jgi:tetratricopeptide (TPR) repeat protein
LHDDRGDFGRRLRDRRLALSMTQSDLAGNDVTVSYVSKIESGQRRPDAQLCEAFAARLGTTAEYLITGVEPNRADEVRLSLRYAELALETGEAADAEQRTSELLGPDTALAPDQTLEAHYLHARSLESLGRLDDAITELEGLLQAGPDGRQWVTATIALSRCLRESGDLNRAVEVGEAALARFAAAGLEGSDEVVQLAVTVAFAHFVRGDTSQAVRICREALGRADALGSAVARGSAYWNASIFESERGATASAITLAERALALLGEGSDARNLARLRLQLGIMLLRLDPPAGDEAHRHLTQARADLQSSSASPVDLARCDVALARALLIAGDTEGAERAATEARTTGAQIAPTVAADALAVLGQLAARGGDHAQARDLYHTAVAQMTSVGADRDAAQLWLELGALFEESGDPDAARDAYLRAAVSTGLRIPTSTSVKR